MSGLTEREVTEARAPRCQGWVTRIEMVHGHENRDVRDALKKYQNVKTALQHTHTCRVSRNHRGSLWGL